MWLSLIIALFTYLLSPKDTKEERKKALTNAALAGGATYAITEYTDWGQENLKPIDDSIDNVFDGDDDDIEDSKGLADGKVTVGVDGTPGKTTSNSLWETIKNLGPAEIAALGIGGAALTGNSKILLYGGLALGAFLLLRS